MRRLTQLVGTAVLVSWLAQVAISHAAPPEQGQREIEKLISALGRSACEFERNGSWYSAAKAQAHLQKKYDYLRKRGMAESAERFIERAASRSSVSGKPYHVRCPGEGVQSSAAWFDARLRAMRVAASKP